MISIKYNLGGNWDYAKAVEHGTLNMKPRAAEYGHSYSTPHHRNSNHHHPYDPRSVQRGLGQKFASISEDYQPTIHVPQAFHLPNPAAYESPDYSSINNRSESSYVPSSSGQSLIETRSERLRTPGGLLRQSSLGMGSNRKIPPGGYSTGFW